MALVPIDLETEEGVVGMAVASSAPGSGIEWNADAVRRYSYD